MDKDILRKLGVKIGHYTNPSVPTGATVFIPDNGADIGIDVRGSDTGSFNIPAYEVKGADKTVEAVVLTGGSTFGLESCIGVMDYLGTPCVTGAVIYDRMATGELRDHTIRPHLQDGYEMAKNASYDALEQGNVGVGTGATTGKWNWETSRLKGGFGMHFIEVFENAYVGAFVVTNSMGDVIHPDTGEFYSDCGSVDPAKYFTLPDAKRGTNTTLAVIVTNIKMQRDELMKVAEFAHDGMARAIFPIHTNWDGDIIFAISPHGENRIEIDQSSFELVNKVGLTASCALEEAIKNSVRYAKGTELYPAYEDLRKNNN